MRLTTFIMIIALAQVSAKGLAQKITLNTQNTPIEKALQIISKQSGFEVIYKNQDLKNEKVSLNLKNAPVEEAMRQLVKGLPFNFEIVRNNIVLTREEPSLLDKLALVIQSVTKDLTVRGVVKDQDGKPLPNASIRVRGKNTVINTNQNGEFEIKDVPDDAVLLISYVGYKTLEIPVKGTVSPLEIKLNLQTGELQEVKVTYNTGYQSLLKERATGSVNVIDNKKYNEQVGTNVLARLPAITNSLLLLPNNIKSNQLVLRGVQTFTGPIGPLVVVDDFPYDGDINNLNPNDIENITLLKDAAAASIWGAKAGNGVVVISTKSGKLNQKISAAVTSNLTLVSKPDLFYLKRANSSELIDFEKFLFSNGYYDLELANSAFMYQSPVIDILEKGRKNIISEVEMNVQLDALRKNDIRKDFNKYVYETGVNQQYAISLRGGSSNNGWLLSMGWDRNLNDLHVDDKRGTLRFNNIYKPLKQLSVSAGADFSYRKHTSGKRGFGELIGNVNRVQSYTRLFDDSDNEVSLNQYRKSFLDTAGHGKLLDWNYYPLQDYKQSVDNTAAKNLTGNIGIDYDLLPGLRLSVKYKLQIEQSRGRLLNDENSFFTRDYINRFTTINNATQALSRPVPLGGILDLNDYDMNSHNLRGQVNWQKTFGKNNFTAMIGSELNSVVREISTNRYYGYDEELQLASTVDYLKTYPSFISQFGSSFIQNRFRLTRLKNRLSAQYTNFEYSYDQRYLFSGSARKDGANLFGVNTNNKWNLLWSVGGAWHLSKEKFYKNIILPNLKVRATYGFGGNVLQNATSRTVLNYSGINEYTGGQIARVSTFSNPDLRWEKIRTINLGLDFGFANDRINGSFEYYIKNGTDLYNDTEVDRTLGLRTDRIQTNNGSIKGNGIDLIVNSLNVNGKLKWSSEFNLSYYHDKVIQYFTPSLAAYNFIGGALAAQGYSRFSLFAYKWAGLNPQNGAPQGYLNGKVSTNYYALYGDSTLLSDLSYKGVVSPKYFGSLGNTLSFRNVSLTARITYFLNYVFQRPTFDYSSAIVSRELYEDYTKRWMKPGDENITSVPSLDFMDDGAKTFFYLGSEILSTRADHIRLQYVNLSYAVNRGTNKKLPFSNIKLSIIANDLGILWRANKFGIDPMSINSVPTAKSFVFSINANF